MVRSPAHQRQTAQVKIAADPWKAAQTTNPKEKADPSKKSLVAIEADPSKTVQATMEAGLRKTAQAQAQATMAADPRKNDRAVMLR